MRRGVNQQEPKPEATSGGQRQPVAVVILGRNKAALGVDRGMASQVVHTPLLTNCIEKVIYDEFYAIWISPPEKGMVRTSP